VAKILTIEDEDNLRYTIRKSLTKAGHDLDEAANLADGRHKLAHTDFDAVLTDVSLPDGDGTALVTDLRAEGFAGAIVVMTAYGSVERAVEAMKAGADEYLQKPLSLEELSLVIDKALELRQVRTRLRLYERLDRAREQARAPLGASDVWKATLATASKLARAPMPTGRSPGGALSTILIVAETGAGKGVLARHIHERSHAGADAPFVHVNCSAIPPALIESELFGHEKGAFTDARAAREGLFEMADGGTIFLDEIGDMPLELQTRLLLVIEQGAYRRVGGTKERTARCRVIAATNQDLESLVASGRFRRDLLYRLNALTLPIPPLRDRHGDARLLAGSLLEQVAREHGRKGLSFSESALSAIERHPWPGNVRELVNSIQRAVMLADSDQLSAADLGLASPRAHAKTDARLNGVTTLSHPPTDDSPIPAPPSDGELRFDFSTGVHTAEEVEKALILQALAHCQGNVSKAARLINMNRGSLRYRIERYGLETEVKEMAR